MFVFVALASAVVLAWGQAVQISVDSVASLSACAAAAAGAVALLTAHQWCRVADVAVAVGASVSLAT